MMNRIPLWQCWCLVQETSAAIQLHACSTLWKSLLCLSEFTLRDSHSEKELSWLVFDRQRI